MAVVKPFSGIKQLVGYPHSPRGGLLIECVNGRQPTCGLERPKKRICMSYLVLRVVTHHSWLSDAMPSFIPLAGITPYILSYLVW